MQITLYIDGDALPNRLKPILFRAIERLEQSTFIVSNKRISIGESKHITSLIVSSGADEADHRIVEMVKKGDMVVTADIPLADRVITKEAHAINHHGKLFTTDNIKHHLAMRNLMQEIRDNGGMTKGVEPFNQKNAHEFANKLNHFFAKINYG
jgi:uncharacterized protein